MANKKKLIQLKISERTIQRIDNINTILGINNNTQVIVNAIVVYEELIKFLTENPGGEVVEKTSDNQLYKLLIPLGV